MKGKTKVLILLAIVFVLVGSFYLISNSAEQHKGTPSVKSTAEGSRQTFISRNGLTPEKAILSTTPNKQLPTVIFTNPNVVNHPVKQQKSETTEKVAPPNDLCENAIQIYPGVCPAATVVNGTTIDATVDCPDVLGWPAVWYKFELSYDCNNVFIDFCGMPIALYSVGAVIYAQCPSTTEECSNYILYSQGAFVTCPSTLTNPQLWYKNLPPGTYYLPVFVEDYNANDYMDFTFSICVEECPPSGDGDVCATAIPISSLPYETTGNSCDYANDYDEVCPYTGSTAPDVVYSYSPATDQSINISLCNSLYDTKVYVYEDNCVGGTAVGCNDDACGSDGYKSAIYGLSVSTGHTYYIVVDGYGNSCGDYDLIVSEAVTIPNDNCADATPIGDVINLPFSTDGATFDGPGLCQTAPNIWYCYTATCTGNVDVSLCGSAYDTKLAVYDGCTCPPTTMLGCNDDACGGTLQSDLKIPVVEGNQYLIEVGGYSSYTGTGVLSCSCYVPPPPPANDECENAIQLNPPVCPDYQEVSGTTIGATNDCPGVFDWDGVWYKFDLPYTSNDVSVDFCPTNDPNVGTRSIALLNDCSNCAGWIAASTYGWVTCPSGYTDLQLSWKDLPAGTYWLPVLAWDAGGADMNFTFDICIKEHAPCVVTYPPEGIPEGEPDCYDGYTDNYNGGCNSSPNVFQDINCNTTINGTSGVYNTNANRDTDWFRVQVADGTLTFKCVAEFPLQTILFDAGTENCSDYTLLDYRQVAECETAAISMYVTAGTYWLWVGPTDWGNYPCGSKYVAIVQCTGLGPVIGCVPASFDTVLAPGRTADMSMVLSNSGSDNLDYQINYSEPAWLGVSPRNGSIPPTGQETINLHFDASVGVGDYNETLVIDNNSTNNPSLSVPVHLLVEYPPDIDVASPIQVGVLPGCDYQKAVRVDNLGAGELRFDVNVAGAPPLKVGTTQGINVNRVPNRNPGDLFKSKAAVLDQSNLRGLSTAAPASATKANPGGPHLAPQNKQGVVWDNGDDYGGYAYSSQLDNVYPFVSQIADDFILTGNMNITDVHWWGQFWNGTAFDPCDFYIYFYADDGTGNAPTGGGMPDPSSTALATYFFPAVTGLPLDAYGNYEYNVTLSPPFSANANVKYWIAVQSVFAFPPQWGWVNTTTGIQLASSVQGFPLLGTPFWTAMGVDMAFYLTGESPCPMSVSPASGTVPPGGHTEVVLSFDEDAFTQCVDDTLNCYLVFTSNDPDEPVLVSEVDMWAGRGDVSEPYCWIDIGDVVYLVNYVLKNGPAPSPLCMGDCDPSHDGVVDLADVVYLIQFLFQKGAPPQVTPAHGQTIQR
jgi:hypothetical protein